MNTWLLFVCNSILLGVGLAMDAFSVSVANAVLESDMSRHRAAGIAGVYGAFQTAMPLAGWICVRTAAQSFRRFEQAVPWIALILLLFIGGKMLLEGIRGGEMQQTQKLTVPVLLLQGVATSIDAVSVGFTLNRYTLQMAAGAAGIIGAVTFGICLGGLKIGRAVGTKWSNRAAVIGGLILIGIGIEIFLTGL